MKVRRCWSHGLSAYEDTKALAMEAAEAMGSHVSARKSSPVGQRTVEAAVQLIETATDDDDEEEEEGLFRQKLMLAMIPKLSLLEEEQERREGTRFMRQALRTKLALLKRPEDQQRDGEEANRGLVEFAAGVMSRVFLKENGELLFSRS